MSSEQVLIAASHTEETDVFMSASEDEGTANPPEVTPELLSALVKQVHLVGLERNHPVPSRSPGQSTDQSPCLLPLAG